MVIDAQTPNPGDASALDAAESSHAAGQSDVVAQQQGHATSERVDPLDDRGLRARARRSTILAYAAVVSASTALISGGHTYSIDDEIKFQTTRSLLHLKPDIAHQADVFPQLYSARSDGSFVGVYTLGQSIVAMPFYIFGRLLSVFGSGVGIDFTVRASTFMTNSYILAAIAAVLVLVAVEVGASERAAYALSVTYVVGTYALPHAKTFFPELGSALCLLIAVLLAVRARRYQSAELVFWCGVAVGSATLFRSNAPAYVLAFALYLLVAFWRSEWTQIFRVAVRGLGGLAVPAAFIALTNYWRFRDPLGAASYPVDYPLLDGLKGLLLSPGKSIFLYAPVVVLAVLSAALNRRAWTLETALCTALVATNLIVVGRVSFWSGDAAWGPRYLQETLPLMLVPLAYSIDRPVWRTASRGFLGLGFLIAVVPAVIVYFNVYLIDGMSSSGESNFVEASHNELEWSPILGQAELVPEAIRDVFGADRPDEPPRGEYTFQPLYDYGYFGHSPRVDFWWLWIEPTGASRTTYFLLVPLIAQFAYGARCLIKMTDVASPGARSGSRNGRGSLLVASGE